MYDSDSNQSLKSALKPRHVQMMALGGVIGMGLFVGSSVVIQSLQNYPQITPFQ